MMQISDLEKSTGCIKSPDFPLQLAKLKDFLSKNPVCEDISVPLVSSWLMPRPPIFIDVPVTVISGVRVPALSPSELLEEECMTFIADMLGKQDLELTSYKSTKAKNHLFW
jgi:hypothetical protein